MDKRKHAKLDECLQALYLMTARRRYADIAQNARKESLSHEEYLLCVVEEEAQDDKADVDDDGVQAVP